MPAEGGAGRGAPAEGRRPRDLFSENGTEPFGWVFHARSIGTARPACSQQARGQGVDRRRSGAERRRAAPSGALTNESGLIDTKTKNVIVFH